MSDEPLSEWDVEEKTRAQTLIAFKHVDQYVARVSRITVSTNNNLASNVFPSIWIRGESCAPHPR